MRWLWRGLGYGLPWRVQWTIAGAVAVMLMFSAGIAATGIAHQTGWLVRSPQPLTKYGGRSREVANRVKCASNMRQLGQVISHYSRVNGGQRPPALQAFLDAAADQDVGIEVFVCPSSNDEKAVGPTTRGSFEMLTRGPHLSYIYVAPEAGETDGGDSVVLYERASHHSNDGQLDDGMNILFGDGHVEFVPIERAKVMLARHGASVELMPGSQ
jgi:prepilin-type processing-associated H-X9-DG protein